MLEELEVEAVFEGVEEEQAGTMNSIAYAARYHVIKLAAKKVPYIKKSFIATDVTSMDIQNYES